MHFAPLCSKYNELVTFLKTFHDEEWFVITTLGFGDTTGNFETEKESNFSRLS